MAKRKKKSKYTEGVLARDRRKGDQYIIFFPGACRKQIALDYSGNWEESLRPGEATQDAFWNCKLWTEEAWLALYKKADLPRRGSAYECFVEL